MTRRLHADFDLELFARRQLRLSISEEGRGILASVGVDPAETSAPDLLMAALGRYPWSADLTITTNFPFEHWHRRSRTALCVEVVAAARRDAKERSA